MTPATVLDGIEVVVFDKDGTLVDFHAMWGGWARDLGMRLEAAARRPVAGDVFATIGFDPVSGRVAPGGPLATSTMGGIFDTIATVLRRWCPSVAAARRVTELAWSIPDPVALAVPLADVPSLFDALRGSGRRIGVCTTDDRAPTAATLAAFGVAPLVDAVACGDDGYPVKPAPDALLRISAQLGVAPAAIAHVGDTPADLRMARAAGARAVGVLSGLGDAETLGPLADVLLGSVADLPV